jgi:hypothetical protein
MSRPRSAFDAAVAAPRRACRAELPIRRIRVTTSIQAKANVSGGKASPEISASTSWFVFSDQFHRR